MFRSARNKFDSAELFRKLKRFIEDRNRFFTYRRLFLLVIGICVFFYTIPPVFRYFKAPEKKDLLWQCMEDRLTPFFLQSMEYDAHIQHFPLQDGEQSFIPYVGNGYFGLEVSPDSVLNIKSGRSMQLATEFQPIISAYHKGNKREATVAEYLTGIVHRFQCFPTFFVSHRYYAHRSNPSIFMQEIKLTNTINSMQEVKLTLPRIQFQASNSRTLQLGATLQQNGLKEFEVVTGTVTPKPNDSNHIIVVCIVKPTISRVIQLKNRGTFKIEYPIALHYSKPITKQQLAFTTEDMEKKAIQAMTNVLQKFQSKGDFQQSLNAFRQEHINVWSDLWATGFTISTSKAENSLNGDRINATMYAVLSQTRSYEFEEYTSLSAPSKQEIGKALTYAEGCYDSFYTLQAENLWRTMDSLENLNSLVSSWILTLEKQGCHNLIRAGSSGIIQAMVLSFGSFRFSNQHLECNMHPKYLHRDFHFRRLNYGNKTHVNVTITVMEDNKAVINVALDRSDRSYYACDGGCSDDPVLLTQSKRQFPVKLTEPLTAILYITEDYQHIKELRDAIHVKEVAEAPAHEQHVIALHKHGHQLGGLPTLFWVSICAIIIVFHVFLCKLIIKEYCESSDKIRYRYNKP